MRIGASFKHADSGFYLNKNKADMIFSSPPVAADHRECQRQSCSVYIAHHSRSITEVAASARKLVYWKHQKINIYFPHLLMTSRIWTFNLIKLNLCIYKPNSILVQPVSNSTLNCQFIGYTWLKLMHFNRTVLEQIPALWPRGKQGWSSLGT